MSIADLLDEYRIASDFIPIDLYTSVMRHASKAESGPGRLISESAHLLEALLFQYSKQETGHGVVVCRHVADLMRVSLQPSRSQDAQMSPAFASPLKKLSTQLLVRLGSNERLTTLAELVLLSHQRGSRG